MREEIIFTIRNFNDEYWEDEENCVKLSSSSSSKFVYGYFAWFSDTQRKMVIGTDRIIGLNNLKFLKSLHSFC